MIVADGAERWWDGLSGASVPKIFAKLPFIEVPSRPAGLAAYVVGPPLKDKSTPDIEVLACAAAERAEAAISAYGGRVVARLADELVVELPTCAKLPPVVPGARRIWYPVTPTLSVEAAHASAIELLVVEETVSPAGAVGGVVSGVPDPATYPLSQVSAGRSTPPVVTRPVPSRQTCPTM